jgi:hypothetical protein
MDLSKFSDDTLQNMASGQPLDYSKLSDDELNEMAGSSTSSAASTKDVSPMNPMPDLSSLEDALTGAGDTLGVSQQVGGAAEAIPNALQSALHNISPDLANASPTQVNAALAKMGFKGDLGPQSSAEMYKQGTKDTIAQQQQALERSPLAYRAGELGGLGLGGAATAGLMPEIAGAGTVGALRNVMPQALAKTAAAAVNAAPVGALYGALGSQGSVIGGTPQEQQQVLQSAKSGAELGGGLGALSVPIGSGLSALAKTPMAKQLAGLYQMGKEGINLGSEEAQLGTTANPESLTQAMSQHDTRAANELLDGLNKVDDDLGQDVGDALKTATDNNVNIKANPNTSNMIDKLMGNLPDVDVTEEGLEVSPSDEYTEFKNLSDYANKFKQDGLSPMELWKFRGSLADIGKNLKNSSSAQDRIMASDVFKLTDALGSTLKNNVPDYGAAAQRMSEFRQLMPETILSKDNPIDVTSLRMSGTRNVDTKLLNNLKNMIRGIYTNDPTATGSFTNFMQGMNDLNKNELMRKASGSIPSTIFDDLGFQPQQIEQEIKQSAYRSKLIQDYTGATGTDLFDKLAGIPKKAGEVAANKAGLAVSNAQAYAAKNPLIATSNKLYAATDDALKNFSENVLGKIPGQETLSNALNKAVANKDEVAKNAVLFSIMQNPSLRSLVESNNLDLEPK